MADSQNLSPCKANFNGSLRRFLISRPAVWSDFEHKLRNVYSLPASAAIDVQYKDEEGDVISLNTDSELEDVLATHALFTQIAPVRFDVLLRSGQDLPAPDTTTAAPAADVVEPYNILQPAEPQPQRERSKTVTSDDNSDDGSLIEFEEAQETATLTESALNQPIAYPQEDLHEATLRQEQEMIEAQKLQAPLFPASFTSHETTMDLEETNKDEVTNKSSSRRSSKSSSPAMVPVAEFEALRMDSAPDVMDSIVASAIEQHAQDVAAAVQAHSESEGDNDAHADPAEPEITEPAVPHGDRALIEQFQMLIQEFQHVIQNNPQLVTIAGSIMNKILSNVQVNVESFATYLQEAARNAQASAEEAATSAHEAAAEATRSCPFGGSGSDNPFLSNPFFAHHHRGRSGGRRGHKDPFSGHHEDPFSGHHEDPFSGHHHRGGRGGFGGFGGRGGGRGGSFGRGAGHQWGFGPLFPSMPPMPPMPGMPHMPPMPPMPPMPGMPGMFPSEGTSVPNTKPSPFSGGFPFHFGAPGSCKRGNNFRFKGDRPTACDTESSEKMRRSCSENKGKNASSSSSDEATATTQKQQGESSSSAQQQPQMTEVGNGWTWTLLPDETSGAADPKAEPLSSSSRPKYGWVWNGGEHGDTENPEPAPIYVESDEEMAEPTQDGPQGTFDFGRRGGRGGRGRGGFAFFRGRGGSRGSHPFAFHPQGPEHGGHPFAFHPHGPHHGGPHGHGPHGHGPHTHHGPEHHGHLFDHHHHHGHNHRHHRRDSGSKSAEEGHAESGSDEKLRRRQTFHEQRQARIEQRQAQEEQRKVQEEQRKVQEEQRKVQKEQRKVHEEQQRVQEQQRREARSYATTATPIGGGSLAGIWPNTPAASAAPSTPAAPAAPLSLNASNDDFKNEIKMLTSMGFADTPELRTVVRDFGGEVEAVVEFMISAGRQ
ncbi:hypothetical protein BGZ90_007205 [Linnemannia elongata]|nr:hypothetical protein BGZ90_007205 [Linnemannia elongata]